MSSVVTDPELAAALTGADVAVGQLGRHGFEPADAHEAYAYVRALEAVQRRVRSLQVEALNTFRRTGTHRIDGHASPQVMVRHAANLSPAEAGRRGAMAAVLRSMPLVAAAFADGAIGPCQVERAGRTLSNPRVRAAFIDQDANVAVLAHRLPYVEFDAKLTDWERLEDQDGARQKAERAQADRKHRIYADTEGHTIDAFIPGLAGVQIKAIHDRFRQREFDADWAEARERLGDAATVADLRRTDAQRSADAATAAWRAANEAQAAEPGGSLVIANIVIDEESLDREVHHACGDDPGPDPRAETLLEDAVDDLDDDLALGEGSVPADETHGSSAPNGRHRSFRCHTEDGVPIHPSEALAAVLTGHVRRVILGADGVVLDQGRLQRLFKGPQRAAVMLSGHRCSWVGCLVPTSQCQADHLTGFNGPGEGCTCPQNGGPTCGRHNRYKEQGFTVYRDERGRIHVLRPDGTEIL
ncbi:DUF222 domain-containing protein [Aquihabitans sp. McL0605]|uniref:HNH endonuclease signature motif containing protein n=1 Tax=Aquihabitans sp. McL0605 TaxID=3415671 RepID=UPI003CEC6AE9